uniref:Uncharacterized protein n=1 Tax=Meloidogyne javanica TaxID=6303 RepID=A0A915M3I5_MELJA
MRLLALWAFALLIALGEAKDKGKATEGSSQCLPGNLNVYLEPNDEGCTRELYQPKYQLPLPREYLGLYKTTNFPRATANEVEFKRVLNEQNAALKEIMNDEQKYGEYEKLGDDRHINHIEKIKKVKPYLEALEKQVGDKEDMNGGDDIARPCHIINEDGVCKIDVSEFYGPYKPVKVVGLHLLRGYLPACDWIKPDEEDVKKYAKLWHTDNKEDLIIHHDIGNDEKRIIDRCSFYGKYELGEHGHPINPIARTGFIKRGELYQWGPSKGVGAILYTINEHNEFMFLGVLNGSD